MKNTFLVLAALASAATLHARTFESQAGSLQPFVAEDAFAGLGACGVLDIKINRLFALDEAADLIKPCMDAVAKKYAAKASTEAGFLSASRNGQPMKTGLLIKTDMTAGSKSHRDLVASISRRDGRLLGHPAKVMAKHETAPAAASALQQTIDGCFVATVVRDIRSGDDFVKIYGKCLTRDAALKIKEIRPAAGLAVTVRTDAAGAQAEAYNGFVTVDAGKGPVQVMVVAYAGQIALPL